MSVIAVKGIPSKWNLVNVIKYLGKVISGPFEPLNFAATKGGVKICYLRLSERLDPVRVVEKISSAVIGTKGLRFSAFVPEDVPDLPLPEKKRKVPLKVRKKLKIPELELPHEVITNTHHELFLEIQYKYPGLYNLSRRTSHKLLDEIARIIGDRLKDVMDANPETRESCFQLSKFYRKTHPHFGDFQLILSTLHRLQDAAGAPRAQIQESDLLASAAPPPKVGNMPLERVKETCNSYTDRVSKAIKEHIVALDSDISPDDNEEQIARKKVREELKKMVPYLPSALKQVVGGHFVPEEQPYRRIRIYGEPFLPGRDAMTPFTRRYVSTGRVVRSGRMYNLLMFRVPLHNFNQLRAMDATVINGAKLTIRSDIPLYQESKSLRAELAAYYGGTPSALRPLGDEDDELEDTEQE